MDGLFTTLKWAGYIAPQGDPPEGKRPVAYVIVLINREKGGSAERDAAAAIENILLTALEEGIGSCWLGSIDRKRLRQVLKVPEFCQIDSVIALGYPSEKSVEERFEGSIKYWRDKEGIFHVPKRDLTDILHHNTY